MALMMTITVAMAASVLFLLGIPQISSARNAQSEDSSRRSWPPMRPRRPFRPLAPKGKLCNDPTCNGNQLVWPTCTKKCQTLYRNHPTLIFVSAKCDLTSCPGCRASCFECACFTTDRGSFLTTTVDSVDSSTTDSNTGTPDTATTTTTDATTSDSLDTTTANLG